MGIYNHRQGVLHRFLRPARYDVPVVAYSKPGNASPYGSGAGSPYRSAAWSSGYLSNLPLDVNRHSSQARNLSTHALASPSLVIRGRYGAVISLAASLSQSTSRNQGCAKTSPAPCCMLPYRFDASDSINFRIISVAFGWNCVGHRI